MGDPTDTVAFRLPTELAGKLKALTSERKKELIVELLNKAGVNTEPEQEQTDADGDVNKLDEALESIGGKQVESGVNTGKNVLFTQDDLDIVESFMDETREQLQKHSEYLKLLAQWDKAIADKLADIQGMDKAIYDYIGSKAQQPVFKWWHGLVILILVVAGALAYLIATGIIKLA